MMQLKQELSDWIPPNNLRESSFLKLLHYQYFQY